MERVNVQQQNTPIVSEADVELSSAAAAVGADQHKNQAELVCYALKVLETRFSVSALDTTTAAH